MASDAAGSAAAPPPPVLSAPAPLSESAPPLSPPPPAVQSGPAPAAEAQPAPAFAPAAPRQPFPLTDAERQQFLAPVAGPHIALLLPLDSRAFVKHAEAVRDGFLVAARAQGTTPLPVRAYAVGDDPQQAVATYIQALAAGARLVVGPLTRSGVTALAESAAVIVPTLALNMPDGTVSAVPDLYILSLNAESEARQVAQLAWQDGRRNALTVVGETPLLRRIHQAFVEEFTRLGGTHLAAYPYTTDLEGLARLKLGADAAVEAGLAEMVFLALDLTRTRLSRGYLSSLQVYATSQVHPGNAGTLVAFDLAGVRFLDMPWVLQPEHPAVMVYPRPDYGDAIELSRFYALGIDAFRIAQALLTGSRDSTLDGVTGRLTLGSDHQYIRALTAAQFNDGKLTVRERQ